MNKSAILLASLFFATAAFAQPAGQAPLQIPDPHYTTIDMAVDVKAPADAVWKRVGKFCDIGEATPSPAGNTCKYLSGDGGFGTVRSLVNEVLVGQTPLSYTYVQAPRQNTPYNLYHGTLEAIPLTATTSRLHYVLFFDASTLGDAAAQKKWIAERRASFTRRLENLKTLAEGGRLTAADAPPPLTPSPAAPFLNPNPTYVVIPMQVAINAPLEAVWSHIGHYCDLGTIGFPACTMLSGTDGDYGAVRSIGHEVLVGRSAHAYTYTQPLRATGFYSLYHGTIEARAVSPTTTTLYWTLVYDNSNLADEAARQKDITTGAPVSWRRCRM